MQGMLPSLDHGMQAQPWALRRCSCKVLYPSDLIDQKRLINNPHGNTRMVDSLRRGITI